MSNQEYQVNSKYIGSVGENNTIFQIIHSGADLVRSAADIANRVFYTLFPRSESSILRERNKLLKKQVEI